MNKVLLVLVVFGLLSVVTPVYASDIDGAYLMSVQSNSAILGIGMIRADAGTILVTYCDYTEARMHFWLPFMGPFDGTTGNLSLVLTSEANGNMPQSATATFSLTSATTATLTINSCTSFPGQGGCLPLGTVFDLLKIF